MSTTTSVHPLATVPPLSRAERSPGFSAVQSFLERLGHLEPGSYESGRLDHPTSVALASYQRMSDVGVTGEFDLPTRERLTASRCAMPDVLPQFAVVAGWDRRQLTYAFDIGTPDVPGNAEYAAIRRAFDTWELVSGFNVRSSPPVPGSRPADRLAAGRRPGQEHGRHPHRTFRLSARLRPCHHHAAETGALRQG